MNLAAARGMEMHRHRSRTFPARLRHQRFFSLEELNGATGSTTIQYILGQYIDELIQLKALTTIGPQSLAAGNYYLLSDLLYRSAALTNSAGGIVEAFDTDAYGGTILFSACGGAGGARR